MIAESLIEFRVHLHENQGDKFIIVFDCWADDPDHAEEQAINAYPNCEIVSVTEFDII